VFRILTSWRVLVAVLVVAVAGLALLAQNLERQQEERALRQAVTDAELINELLLAVELPEDGIEVYALSADAVARIDSGWRTSCPRAPWWACTCGRGTGDCSTPTSRPPTR
jgi:hypothetical protein